MSDTKEKNRAESQAQAQLESIKTMVFRLHHARECTGDECKLTAQQILDGIGICAPKRHTATADEIKQYHDEEIAQQVIEEDPLSVEVRDGWHGPGDKDTTDGEYRILLCTGGPAVRILGDLENGEPYSATLQYQDWFTPWIDLLVDNDEDQEALLAYARYFYFAD